MSCWRPIKFSNLGDPSVIAFRPPISGCDTLCCTLDFSTLEVFLDLLASSEDVLADNFGIWYLLVSNDLIRPSTRKFCSLLCCEIILKALSPSTSSLIGAGLDLLSLLLLLENMDLSLLFPELLFIERDLSLSLSLPSLDRSVAELDILGEPVDVLEEDLVGAELDILELDLVNGTFELLPDVLEEPELVLVLLLTPGLPEPEGFAELDTVPVLEDCSTCGFLEAGPLMTPGLRPV